MHGDLVDQPVLEVELRQRAFDHLEADRTAGEQRPGDQETQPERGLEMAQKAEIASPTTATKTSAGITQAYRKIPEAPNS